MSALEIAKLYENLSLAKEDGAVLEMSEETSIDGVKDVDRCLVGKVLSYKKVNREAFKGLIEQIWSMFGHVEVESVRDNLFMFYFKNREDRNRVLQRGPWHFGNSLIVLEKSTREGNVSKLGFNRAEFWVQIHDIPIFCMNRRTAKWLVEQIGPPGAMIGLSWNIRGLGNPRAFVALRRLLNKYSPEFVFLSVSKVSGNKVSQLRDVLGYKGCFGVDCSSNSGGLILLWKDSFKRNASWALLRRLRDVDKLPWLCGGDFNELVSVKDKVGGSDKNFTGMTQFQQAVDECNLNDLGFSRPRLTWNNKREDHRPILLQCSPVNPFPNDKGRRFRFEPFWLKDEEYKAVISKAWGCKRAAVSSLFLTREALQLCGEAAGVEPQKLLENEVEGMLESEELYWRQRSRTEWLQAGDRNSSYFHKRATARKKKIFISSLVDEKGYPQVSNEGLTSIVSNFFTFLFNSSSPSAMDIMKAIEAITS
ncbi:hypothetical protein EZV62_010775 [Acer yangbiense]|uniref:DUF4283 domain-containing protein n=1 Tax=Acer yangbiense TaxID=1000413 RepID=A0A5C7I3G0_9ROSI|nr:hypothetical protein EZV62_010775 [Acer yangbiense]